MSLQVTSGGNVRRCIQSDTIPLAFGQRMSLGETNTCAPFLPSCSTSFPHVGASVAICPQGIPGLAVCWQLFWNTRGFGPDINPELLGGSQSELFPRRRCLLVQILCLSFFLGVHEWGEDSLLTGPVLFCLSASYHPQPILSSPPIL